MIILLIYSVSQRNEEGQLTPNTNLILCSTPSKQAQAHIDSNKHLHMDNQWQRDNPAKTHKQKGQLAWLWTDDGLGLEAW